MVTRVVVVDDRPTTVATVEAALGDCEVVVHADAEEALASIRGGAACDVVITRWLLPGMDGMELVRRLRLGGMGLPILMVSAITEPQARLAALSTGVDDYLVRPLDPAELRAAVDACLARVRQPMPPVEADAELPLELPLQLARPEFPLICIAASTGGPDTVEQLIGSLIARGRPASWSSTGQSGCWSCLPIGCRRAPSCAARSPPPGHSSSPGDCGLRRASATP